MYRLPLHQLVSFLILNFFALIAVSAPDDRMSPEQAGEHYATVYQEYLKFVREIGKNLTTQSLF